MLWDWLQTPSNIPEAQDLNHTAAQAWNLAKYNSQLSTFIRSLISLFDAYVHLNNIQKFSSYFIKNTLRIHYEKKSVDYLRGNTRWLFRDS